MKRLSLFALTLTIAIGLIAVGCDSTGSMSQSEGAGTVEVRMTGMSTGTTLATTSHANTPPDNIDSASVTITRTAIVAQEDSASAPADSTESDSTEAEDEGGGIKVLTEENFVVDLMDLQGGLDTLLTKTDLPPGTYSQLRLITADRATVVFSDGTEREAMVASGQETGFKVNFPPFTIDAPDDVVQITIQWNVEQSLKGSRQGQLVITPVIQATVDTSGAEG